MWNPALTTIFLNFWFFEKLDNPATVFVFSKLNLDLCAPEPDFLDRTGFVNGGNLELITLILKNE